MWHLSTASPLAHNDDGGAGKEFAMALRAAPESEIEYLKTDPDLPAVGVVDRTPISPAARITFAVLGLLGGIAG